VADVWKATGMRSAMAGHVDGNHSLTGDCAEWGLGEKASEPKLRVETSKWKYDTRRTTVMQLVGLENSSIEKCQSRGKAPVLYGANPSRVRQATVTAAPLPVQLPRTDFLS
jgi:hypothetical protein